MRYIFIAIVVIITIVIVNEYTDPFFQKERDRRETIRQCESAPKIVSCICGYSDIARDSNRCPKCGRVLLGV